MSQHFKISIPTHTRASFREIFLYVNVGIIVTFCCVIYSLTLLTQTISPPPGGKNIIINP